MEPRKYYLHIDGMRAIAVLAVLIYHCNQKYLPGGFLGVDIFFVISGFVVSSSLGEASEGFGAFFSNFYIKRIFRIFPALLVCLLATTMIAVLFVPAINQNEVDSKLALAAHFAASNLILFLGGKSYFSGSLDLNPFLHTWSLGVEEQFYLIAPFLLYFYKGRTSHKYTWPIVIAALTFASLAWSVQTNSSLEFYSPLSRFWQIGLGIVSYQASQIFVFHQKVSVKLKEILSWVLFAVVVWAFFNSDKNIFPGFWAITVSFSTAFALFLFEDSGSYLFKNKILSNDFLVFIGKISYSLYLYHWPVLVFTNLSTGLEGNWVYGVVIFSIFCMAISSYFFIERPFRSLARLKIKNRFVIIYRSLFVIVASYLITQYLFNHRKNLSMTVASIGIADWYKDPNAIEVENCAFFYSNESTKETIAHSGDCGLKKTKKSIYVVGDSHVESYRLMLAKFAQNENFKLKLYLKVNCLVPDHADEACLDFFRTSFAEISRSASPNDILFLPGNRVGLIGDKKSWENSPIREINIEDRIRNDEIFINLLKPLLAAKLKIILEAPKPTFFAEAYRCAVWFNRNSSFCVTGLSVSRSRLLLHTKPVKSRLTSFTKIDPNIYVWDPLPTLCPESSEDLCYSFDGEKPLYTDTNHLSAHGNMFLLQSFTEFFKDKCLLPNGCGLAH